MPRAVPYLKGHRLKAVFLVVVTAFGAVITLAEPWPLAFVIDTVTKDRPPPSWITDIVGNGTAALVLFAVIAMLGIALLAGSTLVVEQYLATNINLRTTLDFRSDVIRHLQRLSPAYHDDSRAGVLLFRINQQAPGLGAMLVALPDLGQSFLTILGMAYIVYKINAHVAELALFVVPIIYYSTIFYANRIEPRLLRVRGMEALNLSLVHEALSMFRVIAPFGRGSRSLCALPPTRSGHGRHASARDGSAGAVSTRGEFHHLRGDGGCAGRRGIRGRAGTHVGW